MALQGGRELRNGLAAFGQVFKAIGDKWGDQAVRLAQSRVRVDTGQTRASIRSSRSLTNKASLEASGGAVFLEAGTRPHAITPVRVGVLRWTQNGRPMFRRRSSHPGMRKQPFFYDSAREAVGKVNVLENLISLWNRVVG
jgi:hypothetical protein